MAAVESVEDRADEPDPNHRALGLEFRVELDVAGSAAVDEADGVGEHDVGVVVVLFLLDDDAAAAADVLAIIFGKKCNIGSAVLGSNKYSCGITSKTFSMFVAVNADVAALRSDRVEISLPVWVVNFDRFDIVLSSILLLPRLPLRVGDEFSPPDDRLCRLIKFLGDLLRFGDLVRVKQKDVKVEEERV